jgi:hypothetical protein
MQQSAAPLQCGSWPRSTFPSASENCKITGERSFGFIPQGDADSITHGLWQPWPVLNERCRGLLHVYLHEDIGSVSRDDPRAASGRRFVMHQCERVPTRSRSGHGPPSHLSPSRFESWSYVTFAIMTALATYPRTAAQTEAISFVTRRKPPGLSASFRATSTLVSATRSASRRSTCAASFWGAEAKVARASSVQFAVCSAS